jgi:hypothetical protein
VVRLARARARVRNRLRPLRQGVTVVIVNWNTRDVLTDVVRAVQKFSPQGTELLVIDNGSTDGSRQMLRRWPDTPTMLLRWNVGHGVALDLGACAVHTTVTVVLDSDAIPLSHGWLEPAVGPVRTGAAVLAGSRSSRDFVHPMYLAVDTSEFVSRRLSFQVHRPPAERTEATVWGVNAWDTAELLTPRLDPSEVVFIERTPNLVGGLPGMTAGGVVYHHGGVSRAADGGVTDDALQSWRHACAELAAASVTPPQPSAPAPMNEDPT